LAAPYADMTVLGTNRATLASGDPADAGKGTDFGSLALGSARTNTFSITNSGALTLTISGITTSGAGASAFSAQCSAFSIDAGSASNFTIRFAPPAAGSFTAAVTIANDSTTTPYVVNLKGTVSGAETNLPTPTGVSATYGDYTNMVRVTWLGVAGATSYDILRNITNDPNGATVLNNIPAIAALVLSRTASATTLCYDDYTVVSRRSYYYWVRALSESGVSALSYVGSGYAELGNGQTSGRSDLTVSDMVFLPVNLTNGSSAGTVSYRLANLGPDALSAAPVRFDFYMVQSNQAVWMAYHETNVTLAVGEEQLIVLDSSARQWLRVRADLSGQYTVQARARHLALIGDGQTGSNTTLGVGLVTVKTNGPNSIGRGLNDYDGDGKADLAVFKVGQGVWSVVFSGMRYTRIAGMNTGLSNWQGAPGDYDGDGLNDIGLFNPASGYWWVWFSATRQAAGAQCGAMGFVAAPCDFDGDGKTDLLAYREADGYWLGLGSASDYAIYFGAWWCGTAPQAAPADYDGDRLADLMDYAESSGMWYGGLSSSGYQPMSGGYGGSGFVAVPADYDGDGREDIGVYEYATGWWHVLMSNRATGPIGHGYREVSGRMGAPGGLPVVADYDGDGLADPAVYHSANGLWQIYLSASGYSCLSGGYGGEGYQPVSE